MAQRRNRKSTRTVDRSQGVYIPLRKVPLGEGIYTDPEQRRLMEVNKIYAENCLDTMARMPDGFIDLTVTSPPYDNLREYHLEKFVVWCDNIPNEKKQEIIAELRVSGINPVATSK